MFVFYLYVNRLNMWSTFTSSLCMFSLSETSSLRLYNVTLVLDSVMSVTMLGLFCYVYKWF